MELSMNGGQLGFPSKAEHGSIIEFGRTSRLTGISVNSMYIPRSEAENNSPIRAVAPHIPQTTYEPEQLYLPR
jgi:hypothetical protein